MRYVNTKGLLVVVTVLMLLAGSASQALALQVKPADAKSDKLVVSFEAVKKSFKPGEPIRFKLKSNKTVYLYLFSIDKKNNKGYLILPHKLQQYHLYKAGREYQVPEKTVEFVSDRPGQERIILVASTSKLEIPMGSYTPVGKFLAADAKTVEQSVKALRVQAVEKKKEQVVREISLTVASDKPAPAKPAKSETAVFISSDRLAYKVGEVVKVTFGADHKGYVHLLYAGPDGKIEELKKQEVNGKGFHQVKLEAVAPAGAPKLVAVYTATGKLDPAQVAMPQLQGSDKGLRLVEDPKLPLAVYRLEVAE